MSEQLAIIIPAYKASYFKTCLHSIADQTDQRFVLYIGDDNSPEDLGSILAAFEGKIKYKYTRFNDNLGGKDLVAHWERCVRLSKDEPWIWMFSDDDIMGNNCVEEFYKAIQESDKTDLFHYNLKMIDGIGSEYHKPRTFPNVLAVSDFFYERINFKASSFVIEYIFKRSAFIESGGFQNFDLAWCTDDATWIKIGQKSGIHSIRNASVEWRFSGINISAVIDNLDITERKLMSSLNYLKWVSDFFIKNQICDSTTAFMKLKWSLYTVLNSRSLSVLQKVNYAIKASKFLKYYTVTPIVVLYTIYYGMGKFASSIIKNIRNRKDA